MVLNRGPYDDPKMMLDEVFIRRLYDFKTTAPQGSIMVDIGANIGAVTQFFARKSPSLSVHAYEPNPDAFSTLQLNLLENGLKTRVTTFANAVGKSQGELSLWVGVNTALSTGYSESSPEQGGRQIKVPMISLDQVFEKLNGQGVWMLKIDTEGAEGDILEGASSSTLASVKNAIVEYHDNIVPGVSERCYRVLKNAGFKWKIFTHPWDEGIIYATR